MVQRSRVIKVLLIVGLLFYLPTSQTANPTQNHDISGHCSQVPVTSIGHLSFSSVKSKAITNSRQTILQNRCIRKSNSYTNRSTTTPLMKQRTAGRTWIFSFPTKNFAFSTLIFANLVSKCFSDKVWNDKSDYTETTFTSFHINLV